MGRDRNREGTRRGDDEAADREEGARDPPARVSGRDGEHGEQHDQRPHGAADKDDDPRRVRAVAAFRACVRALAAGVRTWAAFRVGMRPVPAFRFGVRPVPVFRAGVRPASVFRVRLRIASVFPARGRTAR
jgi:hypothetical protein